MSSNFFQKPSFSLIAQVLHSTFFSNLSIVEHNNFKNIFPLKVSAYFRYTMEVIVLNTEAYEQLKIELFGFVKKAITEVLAEKKAADNSDWIPIEEAKKLLPYKSKTSWQKFRDTGIVKFTKARKGRNIMYSRKSIIEYLNNNKIGF